MKKKTRSFPNNNSLVSHIRKTIFVAIARRNLPSVALHEIVALKKNEVSSVTTSIWYENPVVAANIFIIIIIIIIITTIILSLFLIL